MREYLLGVDLGTSSLKTVLFTTDLEIVCSASRSYPCLHPHEGWAEQEADSWWEATISTLKELLDKAGLDPLHISAVGIDSQGSVALPVDRSGKALRPGLLWMDRRSEQQCKWIDSLQIKDLGKITANHNDPANFGPKLLWFKEKEPEIYKSTYKFLHANGYLVMKMTGKYTLDVSETGLTQLCDTREACWSDEILRAFGIDIAKLPDIHPCVDVVGQVTKEAARLTGLAEGIPVVAGLMDAASCGVGSGIYTPGHTYVTAGTVQGAGHCLGEPLFNPSLHVFNYVLPKTWITMGAVDFSGGVLKWFNDLLGNEDYSEVEELANSSQAGRKPLIFLPYMVGQRSPLWNSNTRGVIFGLDPSTDKQDLIRCFIEGCALGMRYIFELFEQSGTHITQVAMTGGSTRIKMWNQIFADITGIKVDIPSNMDVAPLGAAITAAVGAGVYSGFDDVTDKLNIAARYEPQEATRGFYDKMYDVYRSLFESVLKHYDTLAQIRKKYMYKEELNGSIDTEKAR